MIIDIHTHIFDEQTYQTYFDKGKGRVKKVIGMSWYKFSLDTLLQFANTKDNLFIAGTIDMNGDINKQIKIHQKLLQEEQIVGIKLYPGYQYFYASDPKVYPIAKLCQENNKPLIFHSGDVYDPENTAILKYSYPIHIDELAVKFPDCKIIIAHFGFPYFLETANVVAKNKNVYTDISGTILESYSEEEAEDILNQYSKDLLRVFRYFPDIKKKVMFGTDYSGEGTPLNQVNPYIKVVKQVFPKDKQDNVFYSLAEKLFF